MEEFGPFYGDIEMKGSDFDRVTLKYPMKVFGKQQNQIYVS